MLLLLMLLVFVQMKMGWGLPRGYRAFPHHTGLCVELAHHSPNTLSCVASHGGAVHVDVVSLLMVGPSMRHDSNVAMSRIVLNCLEID